MIKTVKKSQNSNWFMDLLLDETICAGTVAVPREMVRLAGGVNKRLGAKQKYELLLRIAAETPVELEETDEDACGQENMMVFDDAEKPENTGLGWRTDCYVLGKYSAQLQEAGYFNAAIEAVLAEAQMEGRYEETVSYLEGMIGHKEEYYRIDEAAQPILIYKGDPVCYNILTIFAEQLGEALERRGERVLYFDQEEHDPREIIQFKGRHFKAVIGVQSCAFSIKMEDEVHYLHEYIYGPKYNFFLDHPIWGKPHFEHHYPDFHVLVLDQTYADFFRRFYKQDAILFPPAGMETGEDFIERIYDLTFVGTYGGYEMQLQWIREQERPLRFLANRFLLVMRKYPNLTAEAAFFRTLEHYGIELTDEEFVEKMYAVRRVIYGAMHYYRHRVIETILQAGIRLDVFGDSWTHCPLRKYPNLICHPGVTVEEGLHVWRQSRMSLNVMSWHKSGFTERMAGIMMAGAVLVTDNTGYLPGRYDENDMIIFDLEYLEELPGKIKNVLGDEEKRCRMAESGREKTRREHTWDKRAEQFLELLDNR